MMITHIRNEWTNDSVFPHIIHEYAGLAECISWTHLSRQELRSQNALRLWQHFLSTWEGRHSDTNKRPRVWCCATLQLTVTCQVDLIANSMTFQTCGSNRTRICWKTRSNYGSPRRITSTSYCKGDGATEKVEAGWQVTLAVMLSPPLGQPLQPS